MVIKAIQIFFFFNKRGPLQVICILASCEKTVLAYVMCSYHLCKEGKGWDISELLCILQYVLLPAEDKSIAQYYARSLPLYSFCFPVHYLLFSL